MTSPPAAFAPAPGTRRVAVDAMGSDHAPSPEVEGSLAAVHERAVEVLLVGDLERIRSALGGRSHPNLHLRHASEVIAMDDAPGAAVKAKRDSSMRVCFELVKRGEASAVVSAGNSGAMMACGLLVLKRLRGLERPAIVALAPTRDGSHCVVLDVGANTEVKPQVLSQFAAMGAVYARKILGKQRPRVAVLSNGEEASKGTDLTRDTHRLLERAQAMQADFDFAGYAEGRDFFSGRFDVVVSDGFAGNVCLKTFEGATQVIFEMLKAEVMKQKRARLGAALMKPAFAALKKRIEPDEHGGLPLLGVDGVVIICHGSATAKGIKNGIFTADRYAGAHLSEAIQESIARHAPLWEEP